SSPASPARGACAPSGRRKWHASSLLPCSAGMFALASRIMFTCRTARSRRTMPRWWRRQQRRCAIVEDASPVPTSCGKCSAETFRAFQFLMELLKRSNFLFCRNFLRKSVSTSPEIALEPLGVPAQMVVHEGGDEIVGVVIPLLH